MPPAAAKPRASIRRLAVQLVLLGVWALFMGLAFPRTNWWVLAYPALLPLTLLAVRGDPLRRVAGLTYVASVIWWVVMVRWLIPVTGIGHVALCMYLALYPLGYVLIVRLLERRLRLPLVLAAPMVWTALEYVRGTWILTGFGWFGLGHSQPGVMIQIADFAGAYGVSFVVAMCSGWMCDMLLNPLVRVTSRGRRWGRTVRISTVCWLAVMAATVGYGIGRIAQFQSITAKAPTLTVAVVQTNVPQSNKTHPTYEQDQTDFAAAVALSERAAALKPALIVWPETSVPASLTEDALANAAEAKRRLADKPPADEPYARYLRRRAAYLDYHGQLTDLARRHGVPMLVGAHAEVYGQPEADQAGRRVSGFNSVYFIDRYGRFTQRYDKIHRVPFGEYIPVIERWPWAKRMVIRYLTPYDHDYSLTPGRSWTVFELPTGGDGGADRWELAAPICFEDAFSDVPRRMVYARGRKRVDLLVNLTNDGWYAGTAEGPQHEQIARFRCVENRVPMARSVNTGVSSFIDSSGRVIGRVVEDGRTQGVAGVAAAALVRDPRKTVFGRVGDLWAGMCGGLTAAAILLAVVRRRLGNTP